jgi:Ca2+-binding RTX toxin-like protein
VDTLIAPTIISFSTDSNVPDDGITNDNTLRLTGTAPANSTVRVYDKGTPIGSTTVGSSGAWSYTTGPLANGSHTLTATATSGTTTSAASSPLSVTVDTVVPSAPIIVSNTINSSKVTLNGTAEANSTVRVYEGGTLLGQTPANGSGAWSYTTGTLLSGTHNLTAAAMDAAGNTGASVAMSVTVNTTPSIAAPTIISFSTDSNVVGDRITNDNTLTLSGTAAANSTVKVFEGTTQVGQTTANGSGAWSVTTFALPDGSHSFTATATAGGTTSSSSALSVTVDTVAPSAPTIDSFSTDTAPLGDGVTSDNTLTLTGTARADRTVAVYDGETLLGQTTSNSSGVWSYTTGPLSNGTHSFTASRMDTAGNEAASAALVVTVQTVGTPTFTGTSGNDVLQGTIGADTLMGGAGDDTYTINDIGDKVVELANQGIDKVESTISCTLADNVENLQLMGGAQINGTGNGLNNTIIGNDVSNTLTGGAGSDTLNGWGGRDTLFGESGNDVFQFSSQFSADGDTVADFMPGVDKLDFSKIDASTWNAGDQAFVFDGYTNGGSNGHLWASEDQLAGVTHVYGKTGDFQFHIDLKGTQLGLTASNFTL